MGNLCIERTPPRHCPRLAGFGPPSRASDVRTSRAPRRVAGCPSSPRGDGRAQSPVNLRQVTRKPLRNPRFHYVAGRAGVFNNTHTVVADARPGSTMAVGGTTYRLLQIHFHVHSEHEVNGHVYPVEVHFVHKTRTGDLAALGVFVRRGSSTNRATTPPCTEGLTWVVLTHPVRLSAGQIAAFRAAYAHNVRPLQPLHGRTMFLDSSRGR